MSIKRAFSKSIGIIGGGPTGLCLGTFLSSFGVDSFRVLEAKSKDELVNSHPAAHYINARTMELLAVDAYLENRIRAEAEPIERFRYYRYCRHIGGLQFQQTDQLSAASASALLAKSSRRPVHMPQNRFMRLLLENLESKASIGSLQLGARATAIKQEGCKVRTQSNKVRVSYIQNGRDLVESFDYLVLSDGFQSNLRGTTSITLQGNPCTLHFKQASKSF
jgi:2-polyprenyl-6-methoxyphenol hydroxylase-like FAD-dependent oxidoreductase